MTKRKFDGMRDKMDKNLSRVTNQTWYNKQAIENGSGGGGGSQDLESVLNEGNTVTNFPGGIQYILDQDYNFPTENTPGFIGTVTLFPFPVSAGIGFSGFGIPFFAPFTQFGEEDDDTNPYTRIEMGIAEEGIMQFRTRESGSLRYRTFILKHGSPGGNPPVNEEINITIPYPPGTGSRSLTLVASVNGETPDENGNVTIPVSGGTQSFANSNFSLSNVYDKGTVMSFFSNDYTITVPNTITVTGFECRFLPNPGQSFTIVGSGVSIVAPNGNVVGPSQLGTLIRRGNDPTYFLIIS